MEIVGRTHHALVSIYGSQWQRVTLVMFTLHLDDSGTRPTHKTACATALIVPAAQIVNLEKEWDTFKEKEHFSCFHASKCAAQDRKSEFAAWGDTKINRVFLRVRQISKKYGIAAVSSALNKQFYDEEMPAELRRYTGQYHYTWCVNYAIAYAEHYRGRRFPPYEFVFDRMDGNNPCRIEIEKVMGYCERAANEMGYYGEYTNYSFRDKSQIPGLQCVDDIAWVCNRFALYAFHGIDMPPLAKSGWDSYQGDLGVQGFLKAITFKRESLRKVAAEELEKGLTIEQFDRWEREDRERETTISEIRENGEEPAECSAQGDKSETGAGEGCEKAEEI